MKITRGFCTVRSLIVLLYLGTQIEECVVKASIANLTAETKEKTAGLVAQNEETTPNASKKDEGNRVKSVLMVCSTNQCRSPIAAAVFRDLVYKRNISHQWHCDSAGIYVNSPEARWPMDKRARSTLLNHKIYDIKHAAREVKKDDFNTFDYMLGMDEANVEDLMEKAPAGSRAKIELLSMYDPRGSEYIRHPYYDEDTKGFEECFKIAHRSINVFLDKHM